ncbi:MAG: hypothetical protein M3N16_00420 [Actinomycetota bacterium]|nr:hypothetical protein [Actinomycetota bacterium]
MSGEASLSQRAERALTAALEQGGGSRSIDGHGRVARLEQNMLDCMTVAQLREATAQVARGRGGELVPQDGHPPPMHSAFSSAALAINAFACWQGDEALLSLGGFDGFERVGFERRFPIFAGGTPPHLDVVADAPERLVAVESKCTEYLRSHPAAFSDAYERPEAVARLAHPSWEAEYRALRADPGRYGFLDAAQLIKHYLGLKRHGGRSVTLLYLYWEPTNADEHEPFRSHRGEIEAFGRRLDDPELAFRAQSYAELWRDWEAVPEPSWIGEHGDNLRRRYDVAI